MKSNIGSLVGRLGNIGESPESSKQDYLESDEWIQKEKELRRKIKKLEKIVFEYSAFHKELAIGITPERRKLIEEQIGKTVFLEKDFFFAHEKRDRFTSMWEDLLETELERAVICKDTSDTAIPGSECFFLSEPDKKGRPIGHLYFYNIGEEKSAYEAPIKLAQISAFFNTNEETLAEFMVSDRYQNQIHSTKINPLHASHLCHFKSCIRPLHLLYEFGLYNQLRGSGQCCGWVYYIIDQKRVWEPSNACNHYPRCENVKEVAPPRKAFVHVEGMICIPIEESD